MPKKLQNINFYNSLPSKYKTKSHNPNLGKTHEIKLHFRMGIIGASGAGKTNNLLNMLRRMPNTFDSMILVCKSLSGDPLYQLLVDKLGDNITVYENGEVPPLDSLEVGENEQTLLVVDDILGDKKANEEVAEYAKRGRKKRVSLAYLAQSWYSIPKFIRSQFNYVIIKKVNSSRDLNMILQECPLNVDLKELKQMYEYATHAFESTLMINLLSGSIYKDFIEKLK
jgi:hypothetical protein